MVEEEDKGDYIHSNKNNSAWPHPQVYTKILLKSLVISESEQTVVSCLQSFSYKNLSSRTE